MKPDFLYIHMHSGWILRSDYNLTNFFIIFMKDSLVPSNIVLFLPAHMYSDSLVSTPCITVFFMEFVRVTKSLRFLHCCINSVSASRFESSSVTE